MDGFSELFGGDMARRYRQLFSLVGWALAALMILQVTGQYLLQYLTALLAPGLLARASYLYVLAAVANYLLAFPVALLILSTLPSWPEKDTRPLTAGQGFSLWLVSLGALYFSNLLTLALMGTLSHVYGAPIPNPLDAAAGQGVLYNVVLGCLLAPVAEELLFRRAIINRLRSGGKGFAACASALLFALVHANPYQMLYAFTVGVILGLVYLYTGRVRWAMLLHGGLNLVSAALLPLAELVPGGTWVLSLLILAAMFWAGLWLFRRREDVSWTFRAAKWGNGEVWGYFLVNPGMTAFVLTVVGLVWWTMFA